MPRYFFNTSSDSSFEDDEGIELGNYDDARVEAVRLAGALLRDQPEKFFNCDDWTMNVKDESQETLFVLCLKTRKSEALEPLRGGWIKLPSNGSEVQERH